ALPAARPRIVNAQDTATKPKARTGLVMNGFLSGAAAVAALSSRECARFAPHCRGVGGARPARDAMEHREHPRPCGEHHGETALLAARQRAVQLGELAKLRGEPIQLAEQHLPRSLGKLRGAEMQCLGRSGKSRLHELVAYLGFVEAA